MAFRILSICCLLLVSLLTLFVFGGYVEVEDTISLHWSAGTFDRLLFWISCGGMAVLFLGLAFRAFAARPILGITLAACIGLTLHSLATYPPNHGDAHAAPVLSRTQIELYWLLLANGMLLLAVCCEPRIRNGVRRRRMPTEAHPPSG
ncbi:hypothetical protein RY831_15535 [Noviherbaspirillum sp. CPCC 100848]|uniref:Uncharacterized protein n=1 Tax=Noviherbaspirillum album TaxID=3080276 RepID=A0ABU6JAA2_9BURK|nr:hypothetical protein [Noviherbaspirillum sp. CPCC 100848]MEC4720575.1 hypothetical protein [Noviherbaspirillum sp. CPCC 100848]